MFLFSNISFVVKQQNLRGIELSNGNRFPLIIPLTNLEQWPVPSDVDSRHNPDGAHLSKATSLYFYVYLYLYFSVHCYVLTLSMSLSSRANRPASITSGNAAVTELQFYRHL